MELVLKNLVESTLLKFRKPVRDEKQQLSDDIKDVKLRLDDAKSKGYNIINSPSIYKNMYGQLECLIQMIEGKPGAPTIEDAYKAFCITILGDRAIREHRVIPVTEEELYR